MVTNLPILVEFGSWLFLAFKLEIGSMIPTTIYSAYLTRQANLLLIRHKQSSWIQASKTLILPPKKYVSILIE